VKNVLISIKIKNIIEIDKGFINISLLNTLERKSIIHEFIIIKAIKIKQLKVIIPYSDIKNNGQNIIIKIVKNKLNNINTIQKNLFIY